MYGVVIGKFGKFYQESSLLLLEIEVASEVLF